MVSNWCNNSIICRKTNERTRTSCVQFNNSFTQGDTVFHLHLLICHYVWHRSVCVCAFSHLVSTFLSHEMCKWSTSQRTQNHICNSYIFIVFISGIFNKHESKITVPFNGMQWISWRMTEAERNMCVVNSTLHQRWLLTKLFVKPMNNFYFYELVDLFLTAARAHSSFTWIFHFQGSTFLRVLLTYKSVKWRNKKLLIKLAIDFYVHFSRQLINVYFLFAWKQVSESE